MKTVSDRKTFSENPVLYIISVFFVIGVYFFWTQNSIQNLDYIAINGTFQNYNVIRRLLAGQIPFVEYTVYLGTGHLLISSVLTFLLGNNYAASVLTYEFLSSLSVVLLCYGFSAVRFPKNWIVPSFTALCIRFFSSHQVIESMLAGGNSARNIRAMIMPVCMLLYLSISGRLEAHKEWSERKMFLSHLLLLSGLSGLSLIWGNDYGLVCSIAIFLMTLFLTAMHFRKIRSVLTALCLLSAGTVLTALLLAACVTRGHPLIWVSRNFGSAAYQSWYFNAPEHHSFYYYDFDLSAQVLLCFEFFLIYMWRLVRNPNWVQIRKCGVPAFAMLACFGAAEEYKLFSGGISLLHGFLLVAMLLLLYTELAGLISRCIIRTRPAFSEHGILKHLPALVMIVLSAAVLFRIHAMKPEVQKGVYSPELGGRLDKCADDLETSLEIAGNSRVFSAYASALEAATGQFQPTGTDYIIHCLSDESRQQYLDVFRRQDFEVVSTIRLDYDTFGPWIRNANWFFYREVYENYHMVGSNTYADYWKPGASDESRYNGKITVQSVLLDDSSVMVTVHTQEPVSGIADVFLRCRSERRKGKASFLLRQQIIGVRPEIMETGAVNVWALRADLQEYIPIPIQNGTGSVYLTVYPQHSAELYIDEASCERVFLEKYLSYHTDDEVTDK